MKTFQTIVSAISLVFSTAVLGTMAGCSAEEPLPRTDEHVGKADQALTTAQCEYFDVNGMVQICHALPNGKFKMLRVNEQACINAFSNFPNDYIASLDPNSSLYDPTCKGLGCLPVAAPCDATVPCCDGSSCVSGECATTVVDHCDPSPCQNGASCVNNSDGYTCNCPAGYTGTNCEVNIDECASNPCVNGTCVDGLNSYTCNCATGFNGTNCEVNIDDCVSNECVDGTCVDGINSYTCACNECGEGFYCEIDGCGTVSRRRFKKDINYLNTADTTRLHDELMRYRLATYRYNDQPANGPQHLGFIIDDVAPSASVVAGNGDKVDLYGYTSMAVAAIQLQEKQIEALQKEVKDLRERLERRTPPAIGKR